MQPQSASRLLLVGNAGAYRRTLAMLLSLQGWPVDCEDTADLLPVASHCYTTVIVDLSPPADPSSLLAAVRRACPVACVIVYASEPLTPGLLAPFDVRACLKMPFSYAELRAHLPQLGSTDKK